MKSASHTVLRTFIIALASFILSGCELPDGSIKGSIVGGKKPGSNACTPTGAFETINDYVYTGAAATNATNVIDTGSELLVPTNTWDGATGGRMIMRSSTDNGKTWRNKSEYLYLGSLFAGSSLSIRTSNGNILVCGSSLDAGGRGRWIIIKSADDGASWALVDDYSIDPTRDSYCNMGLFEAAPGVLIASGQVATVQGWKTQTRKSIDGGDTWADLETYQYTPGENSFAGFKVAPSGDIWMPIFARSGGPYLAALRKSSDVGATWTDVYNFRLDPTHDTYYNSFSIDPTDSTLYMNLLATDAAAVRHSITQKSTDAGVTWTVFEDVSLGAVRWYSAQQAILMLDNGDFYMAGYVYDTVSTKYTSTFIRKFTKATGAFTLVDQFTYLDATYNNNYGYGSLTRDRAGNIYYGIGAEAPDGTHAVLRRLCIQ